MMTSGRLSDHLAERLMAMIDAHGLKPGDRLPAERKLAGELRVSRSSLREAIQKLASRGHLVSRAGGGTYIRELPASWSDDAIVSPLLPLFHRDPQYRFDVLEIRHALEGAAAWHAAQRATAADKQRLRQRFDAMITLHGKQDPAQNPVDDARADATFHLAIAEASHNLVLLQVMRGLFNLLQADISQNLKKLYTLPRIVEPLSSQHQELMEAIVAGDAERARRAAQVHIDFVRTSLKTIEEDEARRMRSARLSPELSTP